MLAQLNYTLYCNFFGYGHEIESYLGDAKRVTLLRIILIQLVFQFLN